jgi:hypothetical protein
VSLRLPAATVSRPAGEVPIARPLAGPGPLRLGSFTGSLSPASRSSQFHCQRPGQPDSAESRSGRPGRSLSRFLTGIQAQGKRTGEPSPSPRVSFQTGIRVGFTSRLSCRGRHSRAVSVAEAGIHQPSQLQRPAFTPAASASEAGFASRLSSASQPSQFQRSASPAIQGSDRHRQMSQFQSDLAAAATSPQQAPALGSAAATEVPRGKAASTYHH